MSARLVHKNKQMITTMRKTLLATVAFIMLTACNTERKNNTATAGNNETTAEATVNENSADRQFEKIEVDGNYDIYYTQSDANSVRFEGNDPNAKTEYKGKTLRIYHDGKGGAYRDDDSDNVDVYITSPRLSGITLRGAGDFSSDGSITTDRMDIDIDGSGDVKIRSLTCNVLTADVSASGDIDIDNINAKELSAITTGSGDIDLQNANIEKAQCTVKSSGDIDIDGHVGQCDRHVSGSGVVDINP